MHSIAHLETCGTGELACSWPEETIGQRRCGSTGLKKEKMTRRSADCKPPDQRLLPLAKSELLSSRKDLTELPEVDDESL
ncbi:MAG: hypothetical protein ACI8WM_003258 [Burkholderiaceae bacterium]|jgi:hypothetical protein